MDLKTKRTLCFVVPAVAATVFVGAAAFACTNLATLNLSSTAGEAGDVVTVTGSSFAVGRDGAPSLPVQLHWNGVNGTVLAEAVPDKAGNISATFTVPEGAPGYYVLVATQKDAKGVDAYGTPARASYQILGPNGRSLVPPPASATAAAVPAEPSSTGIVALTVGLGALGLALFGAGFVAFVRQTRATAAAAAAPSRRS
ncbi:MAG: hypothetical protein M3326_05815 [Actinomycetota bacterium]|nr:hypothetical protein [Actinomycetota bacterium]